MCAWVCRQAGGRVSARVRGRVMHFVFFQKEADSLSFFIRRKKASEYSGA